MYMNMCISLAHLSILHLCLQPAHREGWSDALQRALLLLAQTAAHLDSHREAALYILEATALRAHPLPEHPHPTTAHAPGQQAAPPTPTHPPLTATAEGCRSAVELLLSAHTPSPASADLISEHAEGGGAGKEGGVGVGMGGPLGLGVQAGGLQRGGTSYHVEWVDLVSMAWLDTPKAGELSAQAQAQQARGSAGVEGLLSLGVTAAIAEHRQQVCVCVYAGMQSVCTACNSHA